MPRGNGRGARRLHDSGPVGSGGRPGSHSDPGAARHGGDAPPSDPPGTAHTDRPRHRDRRGARSASLLRARGLWRGGDQSVSGVRNAGTDPHQVQPRAVRVRRAEELSEGVGQGHHEGDVQDGHLHLPLVLRRADLRRGRAVLCVRREVLHRHVHHDRGRRLQGNRRGSGHPASACLQRRPAVPVDAGCRRRLSVPPAGRNACLDAGIDRPVAAFRARQLLRRIQGIHPHHQRSE